MDNFDDLRAALGQMTEGEWQSLPDIDGYCWICDADRNGVADSVEAADAAGIVLLKNRTPALLAERDTLAARVAELEGENERLEGLVIGWLDLVTGPDEQGAYVHQRQLVEASMPIKARVCVRNVMGKNDD